MNFSSLARHAIVPDGKNAHLLLLANCETSPLPVKVIRYLSLKE